MNCLNFTTFKLCFYVWTILVLLACMVFSSRSFEFFAYLGAMCISILCIISEYLEYIYSDEYNEYNDMEYEIYRPINRWRMTRNLGMDRRFRNSSSIC